GSDTPQVYVGASPDLPANISQAVRKLVQFQRITLGSGQAADLTLHVTPHSLSSWSTSAQQWVVGTGARTVYVGPTSRQTPLQGTTNYLAHPPPPPELKNNPPSGGRVSCPLAAAVAASGAAGSQPTRAPAAVSPLLLTGP